MKKTGTAKQLFKDLPTRLPDPRTEISVTAAAKMLHVSIHTVYRLCESGELEAYQLRPRGWYRVTLISVQRYIERKRNQETSAPQHAKKVRNDREKQEE